MTPQERDALLPLLDRLRQTRLPEKDAEADQLIRQTVQAQPDAPYILAQTVLMQGYALDAAQDRIRALEQRLSQGQPPAHASGGSFLGGLLGGRSSAPVPPAPQYGAPYGSQYPGSAYGQQVAGAVQGGGLSGGGSSFLRSAAQTAAGVAGGALLLQGLEGLFGGHGGFGGGMLGGFGGAGLLGGAGGGPVNETVNNYYDQPPADYQGAQDPVSPEGVDAFVDQGGADPGAYDQGTYDQGGMDGGGGFDGGGFDGGDDSLG